MMSTIKDHQNAESGTASVDPTSSDWHTLEDVPSDMIGGEEEEDETDELIEDEEDITMLQPFSAPNGVTSGDVTRSHAEAPQPSSMRTAASTSTTTADDDDDFTATNDDSANSASTSTASRKQKKRRRRASISDSENPHHRPVKQHRSQAPSPPSLPSSQRLPESDALPLSSSSYAISDLQYTPRSPAISLGVTGGPTTATSSTLVQQHAPVAPTVNTSTVLVTQGSAYSHGVQPRYVLIDPADRNDVAAMLMQLLAVVRSRNDVSRLGAASAAGYDAATRMDVDDLEQDEQGTVNASRRATPDALRESASPRPRRSVPPDLDASVSSEDEDQEYNARHSRTILRSLGASYRMHGNPHVPATNANRIVPQTPLVLRNPIAVVPQTPQAGAWNEAVTSIYGPGSETRGLDKPKPPRKPRTKLASSNANPTSVPPSAATSVRAVSENASVAGSSAQPIDIDAPTEEELQEQADRWATLVRSFVKGKNTRARNQDKLLKALCDAGSIDLPSIVLARSGLYTAARALGQQAAGDDMFAAVDAARALAERWLGEFGEGALEEEV